MKRICFNLFDAHSVIFQDNMVCFGGAEVRGVTLAKGLSEKAYDVSVIIRPNKTRIKQRVQKLWIVSHAYYSPLGLSLYQKIYLQFLYYLCYQKKVSSLDQFYKWYPYIQIQADYYMAFEITELTRQFVSFCKTFGKKFVLFIASDGELSYQNEVAQQMGVKRELADYIIKNANCIFVQNQYQLRKLEENFNCKGIQINNPLPVMLTNSLPDNKTERKYILWIGRSNENKQPATFVALAKDNPQELFYMVMNCNNKQIHNQVLDSLPSNVIYKESLLFDELNTIFNQSKVFVNTSLYEGFPNTFLQAGYFSVPVLSLHVNPNNFITEHTCGIFCESNLQMLQDGMRELIEKSKLYGNNIHTYVTNYHNEEDIVKKISLTLSELA